MPPKQSKKCEQSQQQSEEQKQNLPAKVEQFEQAGSQYRFLGALCITDKFAIESLWKVVIDADKTSQVPYDCVKSLWKEVQQFVDDSSSTQIVQQSVKNLTPVQIKSNSL